MEIRKSFLDRRAILGLLLVFLGLMFLAEDSGFIKQNIKDIIFSWKMLVIFIGVLSITKKGSNIFGFTMVLIGGFFLLLQAGFGIELEFGRVFWPMCLVGIGILMLFKRKKSHHWEDWQGKDRNCFWTDKPTIDTLDEVNVFSGCERKITSKAFKGGKVTSVFGGSTYDMLECELADGENELDIINIFGGVKMMVPSDWRIHIDVVSVFGGFADKRRSVSDSQINSSKILHIKGVSIFGGGEIKNF
jgi:predicted membrane protein